MGTKYNHDPLSVSPIRRTFRKKKKKILISIDWFLPGTKSGGPVRSYANIIAHFQHEFDFYIITRDTDYCEAIPYATIQKDVWNRYNENTQIYYVSQENLNLKKLKEILVKYD